MKDLEPRHNRFDLRWRACGVPIRVTPLFWFSSAALGLRYYAYPQQGSLGFFLFWMAAVFVSVLLHEAAHVFAGRLFGMRAQVVLSGLGGVTLGIEALPRRWQRLVVLLAGPAIQFLVVAAVWGITSVPFPQVFRDWGWETSIATGMDILQRINLYWALVNVVPLWPLDGGWMTWEIGEAILGRRGRSAAMFLSIITAGLLALAVIHWYGWWLLNRYDPRHLLFQGEICVLLMYTFLFWLRGFRELWPEQAELPSS